MPLKLHQTPLRLLHDLTRLDSLEIFPQELHSIASALCYLRVGYRNPSIGRQQVMLEKTLRPKSLPFSIPLRNTILQSVENDAALSLTARLTKLKGASWRSAGKGTAIYYRIGHRQRRSKQSSHTKTIRAKRPSIVTSLVRGGIMLTRTEFKES